MIHPYLLFFAVNRGLLGLWQVRWGWTASLLCCITNTGLAQGRNFSTNWQTATKFGVHEIVLSAELPVDNPFDTIANVKFTPPSGEQHAQSVQAFYDGGDVWRARVYVSEVGDWSWSTTCKTDPGLHQKSGTFTARESNLRGRLLAHPKNSRQWITENGRWFLNLSDTAYFLLCAHDGNGEAVSDEQARMYVRDDVARGVTSLRCFLASQPGGFVEAPTQWNAWHFPEDSPDLLRLESWQCADRRLQMLLNEFPDIAVQFIVFPLEGYGRDDTCWTALSAQQRQRLLRNLVARFAAFPQIFWLLTNDAHYGEKYPNNNAMVREVGAYLNQHDPWQHPRSTGHARRLPFYFADEDWVDYVHIEHEHDLGAMQYAQYHEYAKPVFLGEDRYEQDHGPGRDPKHMNYWQRRLFWTWLLSGGAANYGGRWWAVQPYSLTGSQPATYTRRPSTTFRAQLRGLDSAKWIHNYFTQREIDLGEFEPAHELVEDADSRTGSQAPRLMRRAYSEWLVYHPHAAADGQSAQVMADRPPRLRIDLRDAAGEFSIEWYRAESGETHKGSRLTGGDWRELTAPWTEGDVVLRLLRE